MPIQLTRENTFFQHSFISIALNFSRWEIPFDDVINIKWRHIIKFFDAWVAKLATNNLSLCLNLKNLLSYLCNGTYWISVVA